MTQVLFLRPVTAARVYAIHTDSVETFISTIHDKFTFIHTPKFERKSNHDTFSFSLLIMTQVLCKRSVTAACVLSRKWRMARRDGTAVGALPCTSATAVRSAAAVGGGECEAARETPVSVAVLYCIYGNRWKVS